MTHLEGCQIPCLPRLAEGIAQQEHPSLKSRLKRMLAVPWNYYVKRWLKKIYSYSVKQKIKFPFIRQVEKSNSTIEHQNHFEPGDYVRILPFEQIKTTLDPWKELKGCAFLPAMAEYCGTTQKVLLPMQRFLDERDYKVKKVRGIVLLDGVMCQGTPVFGRCDRRCHFFWREEWLEKIESPADQA